MGAQTNTGAMDGSAAGGISPGGNSGQSAAVSPDGNSGQSAAVSPGGNSGQSAAISPGGNSGQSAAVSPARRITRNFFLHIHANKVHPFVLRPGYTLGLGLILGALFLIMILTGVLLMLHYTPSVEGAYNSVKDIVHVVPGGRLIRNIHRLAAHSMVLVVFLHLLRVFFTGSYLGGRRRNWIIGVIMFVVVLLMSFSGYLLPWDQLSYWAVTIGSNIAASARELTDLLGITGWFDVGGFLQRILIGDDVVGQAALTRFFMLHIVFLPLTLLILTGIHFFRIRKDGGISRPVAWSGGSKGNDLSKTGLNEPLAAEAVAGSEAGAVTAQVVSGQKSDTKAVPGDPASADQKKIFAWPLVMWIELAVLLSVTAILLGLAFFIEAPLLEEANPAHPENPAKSPWFFLGIQELVSYSAFAGGLLVPVLFLYFLISIPYKDRETQYIGIWFSGKEGSRVALRALLFGIAAVLVQVFIVVQFGWLRDWFPGISQWFVLLLNPATISVALFATYAARVRQKTGSTRMAAMAMFTLAITALVLFTIIGIWFRGANWEFMI